MIVTGDFIVKLQELTISREVGKTIGKSIRSNNGHLSIYKFGVDKKWIVKGVYNGSIDNLDAIDGQICSIDMTAEERLFGTFLIDKVKIKDYLSDGFMVEIKLTENYSR